MFQAQSCLFNVSSAYCSKHFTHINSFNPHNNPIRFYRRTSLAQKGQVTCLRSQLESGTIATLETGMMIQPRECVMLGVYGKALAIC